MTLNYSGDPYYRHTGRAPIGQTTVATLTAWTASVALAVGYGYADLYGKVADLASALIVIAFAAAGGFAVYVVMRWAKVRSMPIIALVAVSSAVLFYYTSWVAFECAMAGQANVRLSPWLLFQRPWAIWHFAQRIAVEGWFTSNDKPVNGGELWAYWIGEAVIILVAIAGIPIAMMRGQAFCENCGAWCSRNKDVARIQHFDEELVREHMEEKDFEYLVRLGPATSMTPVHFRIELLSCPKCKQTHLLTVNRINISYHNSQKIENAKPVVDRLWLDASQAEVIRALPERLMAVAQVAEATPPAPAEPSPGSSEPLNPEQPPGA